MKIKHSKKLLILLLIFGLNIFLVSTAFATTRMAAFGTMKYDDDDDLPGCDNDARDVYIQMDKRGLIELSGSDSRFGRVTKQLFKDSVERVGATLQKGDTLIIYNSSHGTEDGRICTSDGYITSEELASWIAKSKCSNVLIINDSCHSGAFRVSVSGKRIVQINSANPARVSYTSMIESKLTGRINGVFSKFFLQALDPKNSDANGDGNVTALEILQYVNYGMFVKEHKAIKEFLKDKYADHYNLSIEELEEKMKQATEDYDNSTTEATKKHYAGWKDWWEFVRDTKLGEEGMRWQSPTLKGDPDFIVVGEKKEEEVPDAAGNYYRCLRKCCAKMGGEWMTYEESRRLTKEMHMAWLAANPNLSKKEQIEAAFHEGKDKTCYYSIPLINKRFPDNIGCHFNRPASENRKTAFSGENCPCTRACDDQAQEDYMKEQIIMMEKKYGR